MFSEGVVSEIISGKEIQYTTTCETCSCSKFSSFQAACIHILYRREDEKRNNDTFPLFCKNMFNKRYHRSGELIDILNAQVDIEVEMQDAAVEHGLVDDIMEEEVDTLVLSDRQKYNKVMPVLLRLVNLVSVHGTKVFLDYLDEIEIAEQRVRRGQRIFSKYQRLDDVNQATEEGNLQTEEGNLQTEEGNLQTDDNVEEQHMEEQITVEIESGENIEGGNRFKSLKMKEKVKTKGSQRVNLNS